MGHCDMAYMGWDIWVRVIWHAWGGYMGHCDKAYMGWGVWFCVTWHTWGGVYGSL